MAACAETRDWDDFDVFDDEVVKYVPGYGEGKTMASQIATAVNNLVYKYYDNGDVFDNTYHLSGWCNDQSSYANWLYKNTTEEVKQILERISEAVTYADYENLLFDLATKMLNKDYLESMSKKKKVGTIYKCGGKFKFVEDKE